MSSASKMIYAARDRKNGHLESYTKRCAPAPSMNIVLSEAKRPRRPMVTPAVDCIRIDF